MLTPLTSRFSLIRRSILFSFLLFSLMLDAKTCLNDFETTRMKSTAGAGVGSILMDEATFLNPAPLGFFKETAFLFQQVISTPEESQEKFKQRAFVASDAKGRLKGSVSYQEQEENKNERRRMALSIAAPVGGQSSFGITYRHTRDSLYRKEKNTYKQFVFGVSHVLNDSTSLGLVVIDPLNIVSEDRALMIGGQYVYKQFISLMLDIGADYLMNLKKSFLYKAAIQFKIFGDFYLRFGTYKNQKLFQSGSGVGLSWLQPRLAIEFAMKDNNYEESLSLKSVKETSFSISYRF